MKICILAPSPKPFVVGGAEKFFLGLVKAINRYTSHEAELLKIPVYEGDLLGLLDAYERFSKIDLSYFDMVITTKYPAWMVSHRNHHVYMQHKCRGLYDLYPFSGKRDTLPSHPVLDRLYSILSDNPSRDLLDPLFSEIQRIRDKIPGDLIRLPNPLARRIIKFLDDIGLSPDSVKSYSAISSNVKSRKDYFPEGVEVKIIHHPSDLDGFHSSSYSYVFTASRLEELKRIDLLIEAYKKVKSKIPFLIAGTGGKEGYLRELSFSDERIKLLGFVSDEDLISHYANAVFVPFIPYDEDYGLITLEAMLSEKPVLTSTDSGGPKELVNNGENGLIVDPDLDDLKDAMEYLLSSPELVRKMGKRAKESVSHITWENTVKSLIDERKIHIISQKKPKIVLTTTFPVYPPIQGGQKRIYNLWKNLESHFELTFVNLGYEDKISRFSKDFKEIVIRRSETHKKKEEALLEILGQSEGDISLIEGYKDNPRYMEILFQETRDSAFVVLSHPYLYYAVREVYSGPIIYEAHNCEYDVKLPILSGDGKEKYLELVRKVEGECAKDSLLVICVTEGDTIRLIDLYSIPKDKIFIIENGMDFSLSKRLSPPEKLKLKERLGIKGIPSGLFIGSFHNPNVDALREIEKLSSTLPDILFLIAGSVCKAGKNPVPKNLKLLGPLEEEEKDILLQASDFALNPVISGSGSNLKLLEYIAFFLPVVTTPYGVRGYDLSDEHLFISEIQDFPKTIKKILTFSDLSEKLQRAYLHAKSLYDWKILSEKLLTILQNFVKKI